MAILAAAGDVGGLRALAPALKRTLELGGEVFAWDHRDLPRALPEAVVWRRGPLPDARILVFSTSVSDPLPLKLARRCRDVGMRVECVLDNWMNYRRRLEIDGGGVFIPDAYYVMDELARKEALKEGLPPEVLVVSGHPGLADLRLPPAGTKEAIKQRLGLPQASPLVAFVSEPAALDQGANASSADFRGYTEDEVLRALCARLDGDIGICILPHPREDPVRLQARWEACRGHRCGGINPGFAPREVVGAADGVAGMVSILLYEAWLFGRPTLSLQPGLRLADLRTFRKRDGVYCVESEAEYGRIDAWLAAVRGDPPPPRAELRAHQGAPDFLASRWL